jgi:hypothetical protein
MNMCSDGMPDKLAQQPRVYGRFSHGLFGLVTLA